MKHAAPVPSLAVTDVQIRMVEQGHDGLLGWVSCVIGDAIRLNNIAVRRGREGGLMLTYPAKQTAAGTRFYHFNPISSDAAAILEAAILGKVRDLLGARADQRARGAE